MIVIVLLLLLLGMAGMLSSGRGWGFVGLAAFPFAIAQCYPLFSQLRNGSLQLHLETRSHLGMSSPGTKEPKWGRVTTRQHEETPRSPSKWRNLKRTFGAGQGTGAPAQNNVESSGEQEHAISVPVATTSTE